MRCLYLIHKWTSLLCALVILMLCITGLPLIFRDDLEDMLDNRPYIAAQPELYRNPDSLVSAALANHPAYQPRRLTFNYEKPEVTVDLASPDKAESPPVTLNAYTGQVLAPSPVQSPGKTALEWIFHFHAELFAGAAGQWFLGLMGLLCLVALLSGCAVYKPLTRFSAIGASRTASTPRRKYADLHKLLGVVVVAWAVLVIGTGVIHAVFSAASIYRHWQTAAIQAQLAPYSNHPRPDRIISAQQAIAAAQTALPGQRVAFLYFPGPWGSPYHYLIFTTSTTSATAYWRTPVLIDASTGQLTAVVPVPWYIRLQQLAHPLHFGNYGGLPLKILWALLDLIMIGMIVSGCYLWLLRKRPASQTPAAGGQQTVITPLRSAWRLWKIPLLLWVLTLAGCAAALAGSGLWRAVSWVLLSLPVLIVLRCSLPSKKSR